MHLPAYLDRARRDLPLLETWNYLNLGTYGIVPQPVLGHLLELTALADGGGTPGYWQVLELHEQARVALAAFLGCEPSELAFTENATHGLNLPAFGLPLGPDDEVLLSAEEYPICERIWRYRAQHGGPRVRLFPRIPEPGQALAALAAAWTPRTRCVVVSLVTCETGTRLPAAQICAFARERGAWSVVDVAQAAGQFPVDLHALGCDYAIGNCHKWLCAPKGTGFFYARREALPELAPPWVSHSATETPDGRVQVPTDFGRFELVARPYAHYAAIRAALAYLGELGWEAIWAHMRALHDYLKDAVRREPRLTLLSPEPWEHSSALVTFRIAGVDDTERFVERMRHEHRLYLRQSPLTGGIRVSCAYFVTPADIDRALAVMV